MRRKGRDSIPVILWVTTKRKKESEDMREFFYILDLKRQYERQNKPGPSPNRQLSVFVLYDYRAG